MNLDDYSYEENARRYVNPQVGLNERNAFIDNLRQSWGQDTAKISSDTRALGSKVPSIRGGLTGGSSYFKSRYQTPQANSMIADLRAVAQSQALSTAMNNEINKAKKRYQDAYKAAQAKTKKTVGDNELTVTKNYGNESDPLSTEIEDSGNLIKQYGGMDTYGSKENGWTRNFAMMPGDNTGKLIHKMLGGSDDDYKPWAQRLYDWVTGFDGTNYKGPKLGSDPYGIESAAKQIEKFYGIEDGE